jgi:hypothetical protein
MDKSSSPSINESPESNDAAPVFTKHQATVKGNLHIPPTKISSSIINNDQDDDEEEDNFMNDNDEWTCAICWTEYQDGEDICWSPNSACAHNFHRDCIQEWLTSHDECPCCRSDYLGADAAAGGSNNNTTTATTTTRTVRPSPVTMASNTNTGGGDPAMMMMPTTNQGSMLSLIDFVHVVYAMQQLYHMSPPPPVATRFPSTMMLQNDSHHEDDDDEGDMEMGPAVEDYGLPTEFQRTRIELLEPQEDTDEPQDEGAYREGSHDPTHDVPAMNVEESIPAEESAV